jgi:hypothetical protein
MELWHGPLSDFIREAEAGSLSGEMLKQFWNYHAYQPSESETKSWDNSLRALAETADNCRLRDVGVVLEYHLPYSGYRIDALFFGENPDSINSSTVIELKQWSDVELVDDYSLNILVNGNERLHPSQQALDYANHLTEIQSAYAEHGIKPYPCSYCHNLTNESIRKLEDGRFSEILHASPLYESENETRFCNYLYSSVGNGSGIQLMNYFINGRFKPTKKLLEVLDTIIKEDDRWHLLDAQRIAYNTIWSKVRKLTQQKSTKEQYAILVRGGPGTGKTVIAAQLLADALRNGFTAVHSTGGKAFTINLRAAFKGADKLFAWNMTMRNAPPLGLDLLLVDEAHRIRYDSNTRWTKKAMKSQRSQIEELLEAAKVTVFFLDENQFVRPDEIGSTKLIRKATTELGIPLIEYDLMVQFRCGGCMEYVEWIDYILNFSNKKPESWKKEYKLDLIDSPDEFEKFLSMSKSSGESARIVAGFCWPWSDPQKDGSLVPDVKIDGWEQPWNAKAIKGTYPPEKHPYTLWAKTDIGETQIGCIYSAQGFEFDRVGVIWGPDLVWRNDRWVAQREKSYDNPVKSKSADTSTLLKNAYRVLMTRGMKETRLLCLDDETREHIENEIGEL